MTELAVYGGLVLGVLLVFFVLAGSGHLNRLALAIEAQNRHYGIGSDTKAEPPAGNVLTVGPAPDAPPRLRSVDEGEQAPQPDGKT